MKQLKFTQIQYVDEAYQRFVVMLIAGVTIPSFVIIIAAVPAMQQPGAAASQWVLISLRYLFAPPLVATAVYWVGVTVWLHRLIKRVRACRSRLCPKCAYELRGLVSETDGQTSCPECGARFNARQAIDRWNAFCESKGKAPLKPSDTTSA